MFERQRFRAKEWPLISTRKIICLAPIKTKMKTNEEKETCEKFLGKGVLSQKQKRKGDFRSVVMDLHLQLQYNYSFS